MQWDVSLQGALGDLELGLRFRASRSPLVLIGPNGAGKTTLLRAIAGAAHPFRGWIRAGSNTLFDSANRIAVSPRRRRVGYVPQGYALFEHLTVVGNTAFGLGFLAGRRRGPIAASRRTLDQLGIIRLASRYPRDLSGGERQRVALARALVSNPMALLLDEPLAALDAASRRESRAFLTRHLDANRLPAIVVTHDVRDVMALGGEVLVIEQGHVVQQGSAPELACSPATPFVAELFSTEAARPRT
jgi:ABC-type sulfate/molybdate transport systems ATPase subunit